MARALDLHSRGQGFDSLILHSFFLIDSGLAFRRGEGGERAKRRKREIRLKYLETGRDKVELLSNK